MIKVSKIIRDVIGSCPNSKTLFLASSISENWREIVGAELYDMTSLINIKYTGGNKISVYINIISAASLIGKYSEENIKDNIKKHSKVKDVAIIFKNCSHIDRDITREPAPELMTAQVLCSIDCEFENKFLKSALEKLKTEIQNAA